MSGPLALLRGHGVTSLVHRPRRVVPHASRHYRFRPILRWRRDHGTRTCYNAGCRCDPCTDAESLYSRERKRARYHTDPAFRAARLAASNARWGTT